MTCAQCRGIELQFDDRVARRDLRRYRRRGATGATRRLLDRVRELGVRDAIFLDIGGGVGAVQHELMAAGAAGGTSVDASPAYTAACRAEAESRGHADRIRFVDADFVDTADQIEPADVVTLDRVLCCYPDLNALVDTSASRARRIYGVVVPRENVLVRVGVYLVNLAQRVRGHPFRVFLHGTDRVEARVREHGLSKASHDPGLLWQVLVFTRPTPLSPVESPTADTSTPTPPDPRP